MRAGHYPLQSREEISSLIVGSSAIEVAAFDWATIICTAMISTIIPVMIPQSRTRSLPRSLPRLSACAMHFRV
eukprot:768103-Hanusia_phi.AAC.2